MSQWQINLPKKIKNISRNVKNFLLCSKFIEKEEKSTPSCVEIDNVEEHGTPSCVKIEKVEECSRHSCVEMASLHISVGVQACTPFITDLLRCKRESMKDYSGRSNGRSAVKKHSSNKGIAK